MNTKDKSLKLKEQLAQLALSYQEYLGELNQTGYVQGRREALIIANTLMSILKRVGTSRAKQTNSAPPPNLFATPVMSQAVEQEAAQPDQETEEAKPKKQRAKREKVLASTQDWKQDDE